MNLLSLSLENIHYLNMCRHIEASETVFNGLQMSAKMIAFF